jgi:hypothetical protein
VLLGLPIALPNTRRPILRKLLGSFSPGFGHVFQAWASEMPVETLVCQARVAGLLSIPLPATHGFFRQQHRFWSVDFAKKNGISPRTSHKPGFAR